MLNCLLTARPIHTSKHTHNFLVLNLNPFHFSIASDHTAQILNTLESTCQHVATETLQFIRNKYTLYYVTAPDWAGRDHTQHLGQQFQTSGTDYIYIYRISIRAINRRCQIHAPHHIVLGWMVYRTTACVKWFWFDHRTHAKAPYCCQHRSFIVCRFVCYFDILLLLLNVQYHILC